MSTHLIPTLRLIGWVPESKPPSWFWFVLDHRKYKFYQSDIDHLCSERNFTLDDLYIFNKPTLNEV